MRITDLPKKQSIYLGVTVNDKKDAINRLVALHDKCGNLNDVAACGRKNNIPVGMCGEAAADPMMIPLLTFFGLTEFSVSALSVLKARKCISNWSKQKADKIAQKVMNFDAKQEIYEYLKTVI